MLAGGRTYRPGGPDALQASARSPPEINLPITSLVLSPWPGRESADSGAHAALRRTRRQLYGRAPLNHLHLIILAPGPAAAGHAGRGQTGRIWERARRLGSGRRRYLRLVGGVENERPHVGPQPRGAAPPAVLLRRGAGLLRQDCGDRAERQCGGARRPGNAGRSAAGMT